LRFGLMSCRRGYDQGARPWAQRRGFSLLEVILALAILLGAVAVLGELARLTLENARIARDQARAQLLCESKLAEILAGIAPPEPVEGAPAETTDDLGLSAEPEWLYSVEMEPAEQEGLVAVRVRVYQDLPPEKRPVEFSLVRWMIDPGVEFPEETTQTDQSSGQSAEPSSSQPAGGQDGRS